MSELNVYPLLLVRKHTDGDLLKRTRKLTYKKEKMMFAEYERTGPIGRMKLSATYEFSYSWTTNCLKKIINKSIRWMKTVDYYGLSQQITAKVNKKRRVTTN